MKPGTPPLQSSLLLGRVRERIRYMHYSLATEKVYLYWVRFFVRWSGRAGAMRHPREIDAKGVEAFLTMLATERHVSTSTHNHALSAILFLYREVLDIDLPWLNDIHRPSRRPRIPSVLTKDEVAGILAHMEGVTALLVRLLYGTGMRLMEGMRLRIKDMDFVRLVIIVRDAKGGKDRVVMLPRSLVPPHWRHLGLVLAVSVAHPVSRPAQWRPAAPPPLRRPGATCAEKGRRHDRHPQTGVGAHTAPFLRHPPAAGRHRHPHRARVARPLRRQHHHGLHPCAQGGGWGHGQPAGYARRNGLTLDGC